MANTTERYSAQIIPLAAIIRDGLAGRLPEGVGQVRFQDWPPRRRHRSIARPGSQTRYEEMSPLPRPVPRPLRGAGRWSAGEIVNRHDVWRSGVNPGLAQDRHEHRSVFFEGLL
jgi:hypothetical protein